MIPLVALLLALAPAPANVSGLRVVPVRDRTEVVIQVDGAVTVDHFALTEPDRLVVDLKGARQELSSDLFVGIDRGGIRALHASQYSADVVRVVVELSAPVDYQVVPGADAVRLSFLNPAGPFQPWTSPRPGAAIAASPAQPATAAASTETASASSTETASAPSTAAAGAPASSDAARTTNRPAAPAPAQSAAAPPAQRQEPRISVTFDEAPILDVISTFASFAGRSIVAGSNVTGTVTAEINDQPWDQALEAILEAQGYAVIERQSGILQVVKLEDLRTQEKNEELVTRYFRIRYTSVDSVLASIKPLLSERGSATTSKSTNTLIVTDGRSVIQRVAPLIEQLDVRTPQVTISAKIIFVDRTALEELGVVYDLKDSRGSQLNTVVQGFLDKNGDGVFTPDEATSNDVISLGGNSVAALANARARLTSPALRLVTTLLLGRHSLVTFLEALESLQLSDIQAAPVVTVLDNREAEIQVGEDTPVRTIDLGAGGGTGGNARSFPTATVQFKQTGVILKVTPHVTGDQVVLELHAERSNIAAAPSDLGITFQTQRSDTQVLVNDGETAVIGGLTVIEKTSSKTGIPLLMHLPLIGPLFRTTSNNETKRDLLIMVTPHIVREGA